QGAVPVVALDAQHVVHALRARDLGPTASSIRVRQAGGAGDRLAVGAESVGTSGPRARTLIGAARRLRHGAGGDAPAADAGLVAQADRSGDGLAVGADLRRDPRFGAALRGGAGTGGRRVAGASGTALGVEDVAVGAEDRANRPAARRRLALAGRAAIGVVEVPVRTELAGRTAGSTGVAGV